MTLGGLGLFELILLAGFSTYIFYNGYRLWNDSEGDMEYGEEQ